MNSELALAPELAAELSECEVGATETLTVVVEITQNDEQGFKAKVVRADKGDSYEAEEETELDGAAEPAVKEKGPKGNPALTIILGSEKPTKK